MSCARGHRELTSPCQTAARRGGGGKGTPPLWFIYRPNSVLVHRGKNTLTTIAARVTHGSYIGRQQHASLRFRSEALKSWPCTPCRSRHSGLSAVASSSWAAPRHPGRSAYGCYLPVLTGFAVPRRAGPFHQRRVSLPVPKHRTSKRNSTPLRRVAGSGHRQLPI